ncbi:hypothetical protein, partial [uncultured Kosakonia sp.]|uniref:hypothetical protein n=1 Tax=uncultured Kosakonia sp. TaxID=1588927 RepID=UPI002596B557
MENEQFVGRISVYVPSGIISAAPLPDGGSALSGLQKRRPLKRRRPDKRQRHPAMYQRYRLCCYLQNGSDGVVSPLKSANRSGND